MGDMVALKSVCVCGGLMFVCACVYETGSVWAVLLSRFKLNFKMDDCALPQAKRLEARVKFRTSGFGPVPLLSHRAKSLEARVQFSCLGFRHSDGCASQGYQAFG